MKKIRVFTIFLISSIIVAGDFGGYSIFEYSDDAFKLDRVYLQYTDDLSDDLFLNIRYDVKRTDGGKLDAYIKNAYVDWKCDTGGILSLGMIGTNAYGVQEKTWGYRFIGKSSIDEWALLGLIFSRSNKPSKAMPKRSIT